MTPEPAVSSERLRDAKARRHYWNTMHAVTALFEAMPLNERSAWVNWLHARFVAGQDAETRERHRLGIGITDEPS